MRNIKIENPYNIFKVIDINTPKSKEEFTEYLKNLALSYEDQINCGLVEYNIFKGSSYKDAAYSLFDLRESEIGSLVRFVHLSLTQSDSWERDCYYIDPIIYFKNDDTPFHIYDVNEALEKIRKDKLLW